MHYGLKQAVMRQSWPDNFLSKREDVTRYVSESTPRGSRKHPATKYCTMLFLQQNTWIFTPNGTDRGYKEPHIGKFISVITKNSLKHQQQHLFLLLSSKASTYTKLEKNFQLSKHFWYRIMDMEWWMGRLHSLSAIMHWFLCRDQAVRQWLSPHHRW